MIGTSRKGSITAWAWVLSVLCHLGLFGFFSAVKFSHNRADVAAMASTTGYITRIKKIAENSPIVPKPKIKKISHIRPNGLVRRRPVDWGIVENTKPRQQFSCPAKTGDNVLDVTFAESGFVPGRVEFFGQLTENRKICYVVDCSGSMQGLFGRVQKRLKESIEKLEADQYFYIIFFRGDKLIESGRGRLARATEKSKSAAYAFIERAQPKGTTKALNALNRAMQIKDASGQRAELIYFLTDGLDLQGRNSTRFASMVENLRKASAPAMKINTIGFWAQPADRKILQRVANRNGGEFISINAY